MEFVGRRVKALWPSVDGPPIWYEGYIKNFHAEQGHHIIYDDGDEEWVEELDGENVILIEGSLRSPSSDTLNDDDEMGLQLMTTGSQEMILNATSEIYRPQQMGNEASLGGLNLLLSESPSSSMILNVQEVKSSSLMLEEIQSKTNNHTHRHVYTTMSKCEDDSDGSIVDIRRTYSSVEEEEHSLNEEERGCSVDDYCNCVFTDLSSSEELEQAFSTPLPSSSSRSDDLCAYINGCKVVLERRGPHITAKAANADNTPLLVESPADYGLISDIAVLEVSAIEASNIDVLVGPQKECNTFVRISYVAPSTLIGTEHNKNRKSINTMLRCKAPIHVTDVAKRQHNPKWKKTSSFAFKVHHGGNSEVFQGHFVFALHASSQGGGSGHVSGGSKPFLGQVLIPVYPLLLSLIRKEGEEEEDLLSSYITGNFTLEDREGKPLDPVVRLRINLLMSIATTAVNHKNNDLVQFCDDAKSKLPLDLSAAVTAVSSRRVKEVAKDNNNLARKKVVVRQRQPVQRSSSIAVSGKKSILPNNNNTKSHCKKWSAAAVDKKKNATGNGDASMKIASTTTTTTTSPKCNNIAAASLLPFVSDDEILRRQVREAALEVATVRKRTEKGRVQVSRMKRDISRCNLAIGVLCKSFPHREVEVDETSQMINLRGSGAESLKKSCTCNKASFQLDKNSNERGWDDDDLVKLETLHDALVTSTRHSEERLKALQDMTEADNVKAEELCKQVDDMVVKRREGGEEGQDGKQVIEIQVCRIHREALLHIFWSLSLSLSTGGSWSWWSLSIRSR